MAEKNSTPETPEKDIPQTPAASTEERSTTLKRRSVAPYFIAAVAIFIGILVLLLVFTGDKNNKTTSSPASSPATPVDSSANAFESKLDSLKNEFNNFRSSTEERLDSLTAPAWFRKLDKDTQGGDQ